MWRIIKKTFKPAITLFFILAIFLAGFPSSVLLERIGRIGQTITDRNVVDVLYHATKRTRDVNIIDKGFAGLLRPRVDKAQAATYQIQTGYYIGNGASKSITGLGFSPQAVIIKSNTTAGVGAVFKTTAMPQNNTAYLGAATADLTTGITLTADGFTVTGANTNTANTTHTWIAFTGSDCSASGVFCVGSYQGTAAAKAVTVGFQPDLVFVKPATAVAPSWRSSAMPVNYGQYFAATTQNTAGALFTTLDATGFTVGATNSPTGVAVYFVAFKNVDGSINVGTYAGNATDNRNITGVGFVPNFVFLKNANAGTAVSAMYNVSESYGDSSNYFTDTASLVDSIQVLQTDGFQVGVNSTSNGSGNTIYYAAFGGAVAKSSGSGTFQMASGSYTGTAQVQSVGNLGFSPNLVIIKGNTTQAGVFRTSMMAGDSTAYLDSATANFATGITALNPDGFTVGISAVVNTNAITYYWTAYGNAFNSDTNSGASDFFIGAYYGNGIDNRNITRLPFQPDMVTVKRSGATGGAFRTSSHTGDSSSYFAATADTANVIQTFNTDGFQIGITANVNTAANIYWYFGFKTGANFAVGSYSGTGSSQNITSVGFQPDNIWVKRTTAVRGVERTSNMAADSAIPFINVGLITAAITGIIPTGFTVNTATETNASGGSYRYVAWKTNTTPTTPVYKIQTGTYVGSGTSKAITGLGFSPQMIVIKSNTAATAALLKTTVMPAVNTAYIGSATIDNTAGLTALNADGFTVTGVANTANVRYTWTAFTGSDCSASGVFCIGSYQGLGSGNKAITTGFQPDLVLVKAATAVSPSWRSSAMPVNYGQYFAATAQDTASALFTTIDAAGFTVGLTNNAVATYYYVAFKQVAGSVKVGTYTGNTFDNTNITGIGFVPDWVFVKNAPTAVSAVYNIKESYGDSSSYFAATANLVDSIQALQTDGFQIGVNSTSNGSGNTIYYAAFVGAAAHSSGSGTFQMVSGSYTGTAQVQSIGNLGFAPDLIIIKGNTTQAGAFRTRMMAGDITAYLDSATTNFAGGITALNPDGFTVGTSVVVNTNAIIYYWTAYGNAWNPDTNSGSADFTIGAYYGNGIDDRDITRLPFKPDMVAIKVYAATAGVFRTSAHSGDLTSYFAATAEAANLVQALNNDGFRVGTAGNVNANASVYHFFAFKSGANFTVNNYTGTGASQNITSVGFQPDNIWVKRTTAVQGVSRTSSQAADSALPFINVASIVNAITGIISTGFTVNTATETNASGGNYRYVAWKATIGLVFPDATSVTYTVGSDGGRSGDSITITGVNFGTAADGSQANCSGGSNTGCVRFIVGGNGTVADVDVTSWSATSIVFTVSATIASNGGAAALQVVAASRADATPLTFYIYPRISSLSVPTATADAAREYDAIDTDGLITLNGDHFGTASSTGYVRILGCDATTCSSPTGSVQIQADTTCDAGDSSPGDGWSTTCIRVRVPTVIADNSYTGSIAMQQGTGGNSKDHAFGNTFRILPRVTSFVPSSASAGDAITVNGNHFCQAGAASCPIVFDADNKITFNFGIDATAFNGWSNVAVTTTVPAGASTGNVILKSNSYDSNVKNFIVLTSIPNDPITLGQYRNGGLTQAISVGGGASSTPIYLTMIMETNVSGGTLYPQIEYASTSASFQCTASSTPCIGIVTEGTGVTGPGPVDCSITGNNCAISVSPPNNTYHWQARVRHNKSGSDYYSNWVSFGGNPEASTDFKIDTVAPAITFTPIDTCAGGQSNLGSNGATINWSLNETADGQAEYSVNSDLSGSSNYPISPAASSTSHSIALSNLNSGVTYYYKVKSRDGAGNLANRPTAQPYCSFTTQSVNQPAKTTQFHATSTVGYISGGATATSGFSVFMPENATSTQSVFLEISAISNSGGTNNFQVWVNSQASKTYVINASSATFFKVIYKIEPVNLNTDSVANVIYLNPGINTYVVSAKIVVTYAYTP